jgi:spore maturation protein CgeB
VKIVILGLAVTSSWGNGHATTYRALMRALARRGHDVIFFERDLPWYAANRDLPRPPYGRTVLYSALTELNSRHGENIAEADLVIVGSYVPEGIAVGELVQRFATGVTAFYDIDTPVTLAQLATGGAEYIERRQIPCYDVYLSFTGGPILDRLERRFGARRARPLYCSVDPDVYFPEPGAPCDCDLGYLGTYSADRQPTLQRLLIDPAEVWTDGRFVVAGPQYPEDLNWPTNVRRIEHLAPSEHRAFYNRLRFTLNVTRADMIAAGYSPSVRLFEAAACGTPIISDSWAGMAEYFSPSTEILLPRDSHEALAYLRDLPEEERLAIGRRARERVMQSHTSEHRALELEALVDEVRGRSAHADDATNTPVDHTPRGGYVNRG